MLDINRVKRDAASTGRSSSASPESTTSGWWTDTAGWGVSPGAGTLAVTIGGIKPRPHLLDGELVEQEIAHLTMTFDHDVIDGAPAARFTSRLLELLAAGDSIRAALSAKP